MVSLPEPHQICARALFARQHKLPAAAEFGAWLRLLDTVADIVVTPYFVVRDRNRELPRAAQLFYKQVLRALSAAGAHIRLPALRERSMPAHLPPDPVAVGRLDRDQPAQLACRHHRHAV